VIFSPEQVGGKQVKTGIVRGIYLAPAARQPLLAVAQVRAIPGKGLEGDRYFHGSGSFSRWPGKGRAVSLIEEEALEAVQREHGIDLREGRSRRNLVTKGVVLAEIQGRTFRIGTAMFRGERACLPCRYLERLTTEGVFDALKGRGGWRADVIEEGVIHTGDEIEIVPA
jgi:MOSC domain-containing protein YiiM